MILVDELRAWPTKLRCFKAGAAHLTFVAPSTVDDLHRFALSIGLRREWFQGARVEHYDLTAKKREAALTAGAVFVSAKEQARARRALRGEYSRGPWRQMAMAVMLKKHLGGGQ